MHEIRLISSESNRSSLLMADIIHLSKNILQLLLFTNRNKSLFYLKGHNHLSTTFYDLKVTFGYTGASLENFMSKYTQEVRVLMSILRVNIEFLGKQYGCFTAFLDISTLTDISRTRRFQRLKLCQVYIGIIYVVFVMYIDIF